METAPQPLLALIWFCLLGFILLIYVVMDGFDLGVGILSGFAREEQHRSLLMGAVGYTWHANQTWLVVLGGLLFGAFPLAYGVVLSAMYLPMALMGFGLIFRAVALEFRGQSSFKFFWYLAFTMGSLLAALAQGFILGGILSGLQVEGNAFAGGVWDWLSAFSLCAALGLVCGYALLGATYLIIKTEGKIKELSYRASLPLAILSFLAAMGVSWWAVIRQPWLGAKWFTWPGFWITSFPLLLGVGSLIFLILSLQARRSERAPFIFSLMFFVFHFIGLAGSLYPRIVPPRVTVGLAAAQPLILKVMLVVMALLLPIMLLYNVYQYRVFRGKAEVVSYGE